MMKIMVFIEVYLPGKQYGGPVTSISNFVEHFGDEYDIRVVCCDHDFLDKSRFKVISDGWNRLGKCNVRYLKDGDMTYAVYKSILEEEKPDMIYCSSVMNIKINYGVFKAAKELAIPVVLAPRGDMCTNAIAIKKWKKIPFLFVARIAGIYRGLFFQATMEEEADNLKKYLGVKNEQIYRLSNLPKTPVHRFDYKKEEGKLKAVYLSRISVKKNLLTAIKAINKMTSEVDFDIYGPMEEAGYWELCEEEIAKAPDNVSITYKGQIDTKEAPEVFGRYDCFVFPTFTENYGHVIAEALMHDCPIVISLGTTPWDDVNEYDAGHAIDLNDLQGFTNALEGIASMDQKCYNIFLENVRKYVDVKINLSDLKKGYKAMIEEITK